MNTPRVSSNNNNNFSKSVSALYRSPMKGRKSVAVRSFAKSYRSTRIRLTDPSTPPSRSRSIKPVSTRILQLLKTSSDIMWASKRNNLWSKLQQCWHLRTGSECSRPKSSTSKTGSHPTLSLIMDWNVSSRDLWGLQELLRNKVASNLSCLQWTSSWLVLGPSTRLGRNSSDCITTQILALTWASSRRRRARILWLTHRKTTMSNPTTRY